jgi:hypothetical protein
MDKIVNLRMRRQDLHDRLNEAYEKFRHDIHDKKKSKRESAITRYDQSLTELEALVDVVENEIDTLVNQAFEPVNLESYAAFDPGNLLEGCGWENCWDK